MCPYSVYGMDCSRFTQPGYFPNIHLYHWFLAIWTISQRVLFSSFYSAWDLLSFWNLYIKVILVRYSIIHYPKMGWLKKKNTFYDPWFFWFMILWLRVSPKATIKCWQGLQSTQHLSGAGSASRLTQAPAGSTLLLTGCWLRPSVTHWLKATLPSLSSRARNMADCFIKTRRLEEAERVSSKWEVTVFCNLVTFTTVTSLKASHKVHATHKRRKLHNSMNNRQCG